MRKVIFGLTLSFCLVALGQSNRSLWMEYEVKKKEKLSVIVNQSRTAFDKTLSLKQMTEKIVSKNPELRGKTYVKPGHVLLLPFSSFPHLGDLPPKPPQLPKVPAGATVHYHIYYNPVFYNGAEEPIHQQQSIKNQEDKEVLPRQPTSFKPMQVKQRISRTDNTPIDMQLTAGSYYRLLNSQQTLTGAQSQQASQLNYILSYGITHSGWKDFDFHHSLSYSTENYDNFSLNLFTVSSQLIWRFRPDLEFSSGVQYLQTPVVTLNNNTLVLDTVAHPQLFVNTQYYLPSFWQLKPSVGAQVNYLLAGSNDIVQLQSGLTYSIMAQVDRDLFSQNWSLQTWWSGGELELNSAKQEISGLGFSLAWNTSF